MDEELKKAMEEGKVLAIGESKGQRNSSKNTLTKNLSSKSLQQIKLNLADYNSPIGVDFEKTLLVPEYLTFRAVLEIILQQENFSKQKRYEVEKLLSLYSSGKISEFLAQLTQFLNKTDSKKRFCIDFSYIILLILRMILSHVISKKTYNFPNYTLESIVNLPSVLDSGDKGSEIIENISIMIKSKPSDPNYKNLDNWTKLLLWSNTLLLHYNQFSEHKDEKLVNSIHQSIENQNLTEAIDLINNKIFGDEGSIPTDNESKPISKLTKNQLILTMLWGMHEILQ
ncbi:MAG: hypothetical protein ACTSYI_14925 [Promethearchaeota archaeon]